eukprot:scaffold3734_cov425-Prasinococcus_capsulatus_cf.AAC.7
MEAALEQAEKAYSCDEVPVGCVVVHNNSILAVGRNRTNEVRTTAPLSSCNGTRHAELEAIETIERTHPALVPGIFTECDLYVTVEPCIMCAGALSLLRFRKVLYGCRNDKFGGCGSVLNIHQEGCIACGIEGDGEDGLRLECCGGLYAQRAVELLRKFYSTGNPKGIHSLCNKN